MRGGWGRPGTERVGRRHGFHRSDKCLKLTRVHKRSARVQPSARRKRSAMCLKPFASHKRPATCLKPYARRTSALPVLKPSRRTSAPATCLKLTPSHSACTFQASRVAQAPANVLKPYARRTSALPVPQPYASHKRSATCLKPYAHISSVMAGRNCPSGGEPSCLPKPSTRGPTLLSRSAGRPRSARECLEFFLLPSSGAWGMASLASVRASFFLPRAA